MPPARTVPPIATASSTQRWVRDAWCCVDHRADIGRRIERVAELEVLTPARNLSMNASQIDSWTNIRWTLMQTWPA